MLSNRWTVLALLFAVRTGMGFQFQAVPSLSPLFLADFRVSVADIGMLIGLYHAPGIVLALPGGAFGRIIGDKRAVLLGLALMIAGGIAIAALDGWPVQIAGRLVAGAGGIFLNVVMAKMVADWFAGKEIATAMGIFVNSWPVGIALALLVLPQIAGFAGLGAALLAVTVYLVLVFAALALLYREPDQTSQPIAHHSTRPQGAVLLAVLAAGAIWGCYNAALGMIFGFGPLMLAERGWNLAAASSATSVSLWLVAISVPLGGIVADRTGRPFVVLVGGFAAFAATLMVARRTELVLPAFIVLGLVSGLPAGPIMSLPATVLSPQSRSFGMGLFFTVFYSVQMTAPGIAGQLANTLGNAAAAFDFGAFLLAVCSLLLAIFGHCARRAATPPHPPSR